MQRPLRLCEAHGLQELPGPDLEEIPLAAALWHFGMEDAEWPAWVILSGKAITSAQAKTMMNFQVFPDRGVVELRPEPPLTREDFLELAEAVDAYLERQHPLPGLLIIAPQFPGWADFAALRAHLDFVGERHRKVSRVAIVSDSPVFKILPHLVRHFLSPEVRVFPLNQRQDAASWLEAAEELPPPSGIRFLRFQSRPLIWIEIDGRVTRDDYRRLEQAMRELIEETGSISFLLRLRNLTGVETGAVWDDVKFTFGNLKHMQRIAIVGAKPWLRWLTKASAALSSAEVRRFPAEHEEAAWNWLGATNPALSPAAGSGPSRR